jgi:hypothetical protein
LLQLASERLDGERLRQQIDAGIEDAMIRHRCLSEDLVADPGRRRRPQSEAITSPGSG